MFWERLRQCSLTMHGITTIDADIGVLLGRVVLCRGRWPEWSALMLLGRRMGMERVRFHLILGVPTPVGKGTLVFFEPGVLLRRRGTSIEFDVTTWFFQINFMWHR